MAKARPILRDIPIDKLVRGKYQPRRAFDDELLQELAQSIRSTGLLQPLVVRPLEDGSDLYEIVAGERRWRATQLAGLDHVNCLVNHYTDEQAAEATTIENINRVDLNPIEEAGAYQRLIDDFDYLHEEVAAAVGKSRAKITNSLRLLKIDSRVQDLLIKGDLSEGHGKSLASLDKRLQFELARKCTIYGWSVRKTEQEVKKLQAKQKEQDHDQSLSINIKALEQSLADYVGSQVKIDYGQSGGQLKLNFHNLDVLEGILKKLGYKTPVDA